MLYDYYEPEKYSEILDNFYKELNKTYTKNPYGDYILDYIQSENNKYKINDKGYLFVLLKTYQIYYQHCKKKFFTHPYVKSYKLADSTHIKFAFGEVNFNPWVTGMIDSIKKGYKVKNINIIDSSRAFYDVYQGKYDGQCHRAGVKFGYDGNVITAFVPSVLEEMKYLHTFIEKDGIIIDATGNIKMKKDDYYELLEPEIVSEIPGKELIETVRQIKKGNPEIKHLGLRQLLVEWDQIKEKKKIKK